MESAATVGSIFSFLADFDMDQATPSLRLGLQSGIRGGVDSVVTTNARFHWLAVVLCLLMVLHVGADSNPSWKCNPPHLLRQIEAFLPKAELVQKSSPTTALAPAPPAVGSHQLLFIRLAFSDDGSEPISMAEANTLMNEVGDFFRESSYQTTSIAYQVSPLLRLPKSKSWYGSQPPILLLWDAEAAAAAAGLDPNQFDLEILRHNQVPGWDFAGLGLVGLKGLWLQSSELGVVVHELGHNFGLEHANAWEATQDSVIGPGENVEYGNPFDTMGLANTDPLRYQFNAVWKAQLQWFNASQVLTVTTGATYRLHAFDVPLLAEGRTYALKIALDTERTYWVEFRREFTDNPWSQRGVLINWNPWTESRGGTQLLDMTPGTPSAHDGWDDAALVLGRTFTDASARIHITPLATGQSGSEPWIDVQIHVGALPVNHKPHQILTSDKITVGVNEAVQFAAAASDPDLDPLAYYWDFGDGRFGSNAPMAIHSWPVPGQYVVRCEVSDMKGARSSRHQLITVGSPRTLRIEGRITSTSGTPVPGARVHNGLSGSEYRGAYTDDDGYYVLADLAPNLYELSAIRSGFDFESAGWSNPVQLESNHSPLNWIVHFDPAIPQLTWTTPAEIIYGTPLGEMQLNAQALVAGVFTYGPAAGTVLPAGSSHRLQVTFAPEDALTYASATSQVTLAVARAPLTIQVANETMAYSTPILPSFKVAYAGFVNEDGVEDLDDPVSVSTSANPNSNAGAYPITLGNASDANYDIQFVHGALTIVPASTVGQLSSSLNPSVFGQGIEFRYLVNALAPSTAVPSGLVELVVDEQTNAIPLIHGTAVIGNDRLAPGMHHVRARFVGQANFLATPTAALYPSQLITLAPVPNPILNVGPADPGSFLLWFEGVEGLPYRVQFSETMEPDSWLDLTVFTHSDGGLFQWTDNPPPAVSRRMYRVLVP